jgi:CheY-like chemotaxis protein
VQNQPHLLVAEDDADTRELVQLLLRHAGFRVSITGDPAEVMQLLVTDHFDALLLDNWMPKIDGIELCRLIRSLDQKLPIFFALALLQKLIKRPHLTPVLKAILESPLTRKNSPMPYAPPLTSNRPRPTFPRSVFTSLIPRLHPYTFRAPIVSGHPFRVFYPELASAMMFTLGHFVLRLPHVSKNLDSERKHKARCCAPEVTRHDTPALGLSRARSLTRPVCVCVRQLQEAFTRLRR